MPCQRGKDNDDDDDDDVEQKKIILPRIRSKGGHQLDM